jgi:phytoene dehydrogenase-like protein
VLSIAVHVMPFHLRTGDWTTTAERMYESVLSTLDARMPGTRNLIVGREIITPLDLETRWGLTGGHIFHGESALDQWWIGRPLPALARYRTPVRGLVLASAGTHPGGGLTGLPGLLAAKAVRASS